MKDLFGNIGTLPRGVKGRQAAQLLYDEADTYPPGSPERCELYRRAAEHQRQADEKRADQAAAAAELEEVTQAEVQRLKRLTR